MKIKRIAADNDIDITPICTLSRDESAIVPPEKVMRQFGQVVYLRFRFERVAEDVGACRFSLIFFRSTKRDRAFDLPPVRARFACFGVEGVEFFAFGRAAEVAGAVKAFLSFDASVAIVSFGPTVPGKISIATVCEDSKAGVPQGLWYISFRRAKKSKLSASIRNRLAIARCIFVELSKSRCKSWSLLHSWRFRSGGRILQQSPKCLDRVRSDQWSTLDLYALSELSVVGAGRS